MAEAVAAPALRAEERSYLVRVFWLFGAGLAVSALTAIAGGATADGVAFFESGGIKVLLIVASVVNVFWANSGAYWGTSIVGVLIFLGLTAYDMQKIKAANVPGDAGTDADARGDHGRDRPLSGFHQPAPAAPRDSRQTQVGAARRRSRE